MEQTLEEKVDARIQAGIKIDFGLIFSDGWKIFKQIFWQVLVALIIIGVANAIVGVIVGVLFPSYINPQIDPGRYRPRDADDIMRMYKDIFMQVLKVQSHPLAQLKNLIVGLIAIVISAPLSAGFMRNCRDADKGQSDFGKMFSYYSSPFTGRIIGTGVILTVGVAVIQFAFSFVPGLSLVTAIVLQVTNYLLFIFAVPLIIFENATTKQALLLSAKLALNRFFPIAGFMLLCYILALSGFIACCIGVIFSMAYLPTGQYLVYKCAMGFPDDPVEEQHDTGHWQQQPPPDMGN